MVFHVVEELRDVADEWWYGVVLDFAVVVSVVKLSVGLLKVLCGWPENNGSSLIDLQYSSILKILI